MSQPARIVPPQPQPPSTTTISAAIATTPADPEATQQSIYDYETIRRQNELNRKKGVSTDSSGNQKGHHNQTKNKNNDKKRKRSLREGAGRVWEDTSLDEWPENDYRIFVGDLGNEVTTQMLGDVFRHKFKSFAKAKVIRKKHNVRKTRGFGFVSFLDPNDMVAALKTMNGKYCGTRPMKLRKSDWDKRSISSKKARKMKKKNQLRLYDSL